MHRQIWHLLPFFGKKLLVEITAADVKRFIDSKLGAGITPRGVNMKLIVLRSILRRNHLWEWIRPDLSMLRVGETPGKALTLPEENKLLGECLASNSRTIHLAVVLALCTGMRRDEIRLLQWKQIYLKDGYLTVGHSKTVNGTGRIVPLNNRAFKTLSAWADTFPKRSPEHYVFPIEKYAGSPIGNAPTIYGHDPTKPLKSWKAAWDRARIRSGVWIRFHDLRHTAITRMLEARVTLLEVAKIVGWSPSTMTLMAARYAHLNREVLRNAVAALEGPSKPKASKPGKDSPKRIGVKRQEIEKPAQRKRA
jgi:integrase